MSRELLLGLVPKPVHLSVGFAGSLPELKGEETYVVLGHACHVALHAPPHSGGGKPGVFSQFANWTVRSASLAVLSKASRFLPGGSLAASCLAFVGILRKPNIQR